MERLMTEYDGHNVPKKLCNRDELLNICSCAGCVEYCLDRQNPETEDYVCDGCAIQECFERLAAYERAALWIRLRLESLKTKRNADGILVRNSDSMHEARILEWVLKKIDEGMEVEHGSEEKASDTAGKEVECRV